MQNIQAILKMTSNLNGFTADTKNDTKLINIVIRQSK